MDYNEKSKILQNNLEEMNKFKSRQPITDWEEDDHDPIERKMATKENSIRKTNKGYGKQSRGRGWGTASRRGQRQHAGNFQWNDRASYCGTGTTNLNEGNPHWNERYSSGSNVNARNPQWNDRYSSSRNNARWNGRYSSSGSTGKVNARNPQSNVNVGDPSFWHNDYINNLPSFVKSRGNHNSFNHEDTKPYLDSVTPSDSVSVIKSSSESVMSTTTTTINISATDIVQSLSKFNNFRCSLIDLIDEFNFDHKKVKEIAKNFHETFELKGADLALKPNVKICDGHRTEEGCQSKSQCGNLHICPSFINGNCEFPDEECLMGHFWKTNHNKIILGKHFIINFQLPVLKNLFQHLFKDDSVSMKDQELKICLNYNSNTCSSNKCDNLHLCLSYLANICSDKACPLNHSIRQKDTSDLLQSFGISSNESPREVLATIRSCPLIKQEINNIEGVTVSEASGILEKIQTNTKSEKNSEEKLPNEVKTTVWSNNFLGEVLAEEICYYSVENYCNYEEIGCWRLHSDKHFHWQIQEKDKPWINLPNHQVLSLELNYCDPSINNFDLPPLDPSKIVATSKGLLRSMRGKAVWKVDFEKMKLTMDDDKTTNTSLTLILRRLCTEYLTDKEIPEPCVFAWYFSDIKDNWIEYGQLDSTGEANLKCSINSDDIEKHRRSRPNSPLPFQSNKFTYILDTLMLEQTNLKTNVVRYIRRRPKAHLKEELIPSVGVMAESGNLPSNWDPMKPDVKQIKVPLSKSSQEFKDICAYIQQKQGTFTVISIERIQNQFLYYAFKNKTKNMKIIYGNDNDVNIQQLFHGTGPQYVDAICDENFDWRLHGSSSGQAYGRGTYFATSANYSYGYAKVNGQGQRHMFIAQVAVGSLVLGNSSMVRPSNNPQTNSLYDSSCDNVSSPGIIVKYDKQEYYPEYILTIQ